MRTAEVVVHVMHGDRRHEVFNLLAEGVGQAGEPAHAHPHREVLALDIAGRDVLRVWTAGDGVLLSSQAIGRRVARLGAARRVAVDLDELREVYIRAESLLDGG